MGGVYQIINTNTGKIYIGSTVNIPKRHKEHHNLLNKGKHPNRYLQNAWNKYGQKMFAFEIIENAEDHILVEREQHYLDTLQPFGKIGYNICEVAYSCLGIKRSKKTKKKMREAKLGEKNPMYGRSPSEETRKKLSDAHSGEKHWSFGISPSKDTVERIRAGCSEKEITDETRQKLSESGKKAWDSRKSYTRQVSVSGKIYKSIRAAAEAVGVAKDTISHRCKQDHYPEYKFIN